MFIDIDSRSHINFGKNTKHPQHVHKCIHISYQHNAIIRYNIQYNTWSIFDSPPKKKLCWLAGYFPFI